MHAAGPQTPLWARSDETEVGNIPNRCDIKLLITLVLAAEVKWYNILRHLTVLKLSYLCHWDKVALYFMETVSFTTLALLVSSTSRSVSVFAVC